MTMPPPWDIGESQSEPGPDGTYILTPKPAVSTPDYPDADYVIEPALQPEDRTPPYSPAPSAETEGAGGPANDYNPPPQPWPAVRYPSDEPASPGSPWPDLSRDRDITQILAAVAVVDGHLDAAAPEIYRQDNDASRLANRWRRIAGGPASEGQEAVDALNLATGGNPRKGVTGDDETVKGELGDTVVAALLAIQSMTKDTDATWDVVMAALAKALGRVPRERPAPAASTPQDREESQP
jgi:hypothetical protein